MRCCLKSCKNNSLNRSGNTSFHKFPVAEWKKEKWMNILKLDEVTASSVVCSKHFHEKDFIYHDTKNVRLFPSAMPHFPGHFAELQDTSSNGDMANVAVQSKGNIFQTEMEPALAESQVVEADIRIPTSTSWHIIERFGAGGGIFNPIVKKMTLKRALCPSDDPFSTSNESPEETIFRQELKTLRQSVVKTKRKIKTLREMIRRKTRNVESLSEIVSNLKNRKKSDKYFSI